MRVLNEGEKGYMFDIIDDELCVDDVIDLTSSSDIEEVDEFAFFVSSEAMTDELFSQIEMTGACEWTNGWIED